MDTRPLTSLDGATSELRIAWPEVRNGAPSALVMPALGTPAKYYDPFAEALAARGVIVVVAENRGTGTSSVHPKRGVNYGYADVLRDDWPAFIDATKSITGSAPTLIGHSIGGQLACLYEAQHPGTFARIALLTACSVYWGGWPSPRCYSFLAQVLTVRALNEALGYFPGDRVGFAGVQGQRFMRDWSRQSLTGLYAPESAAIDYEHALRSVRAELLSVSVHGDDYAPRSACDRLLAKMPMARTERVEMTAHWPIKKATDAHFRWAREPQEMVKLVDQFISRP